MRACTRHPSPPYPLTIPAASPHPYPLASHSTPPQFFHLLLKHSTSHPLPSAPAPSHSTERTSHHLPSTPSLLCLRWWTCPKEPKKIPRANHRVLALALAFNSHSRFRFPFPFSLPFTFILFCRGARKSAREEGREYNRHEQITHMHAYSTAMDGSYPGHRDG